jgi:hypothetical protein
MGRWVANTTSLLPMSAERYDTLSLAIEVKDRESFLRGQTRVNSSREFSTSRLLKSQAS